MPASTVPSCHWKALGPTEPSFRFEDGELLDERNIRPALPGVSSALLKGIPASLQAEELVAVSQKPMSGRLQGGDHSPLSRAWDSRALGVALTLTLLGVKRCPLSPKPLRDRLCT